MVLGGPYVDLVAEMRGRDPLGRWRDSSETQGQLLLDAARNAGERRLMPWWFQCLSSHSCDLSRLRALGHVPPTHPDSPVPNLPWHVVSVCLGERFLWASMSK